MKSVFLITIFSVGILTAWGQKIVNALKVDYKIEIESGRDPKRPEELPPSIIVYNTMFIFNNKAVYVTSDSTKKWSDYKPKEKSLLWRKGKTSYRYEFKDSNCCVLYSNLKERYRQENTSIEETIAGKKTKKEIIYDDVNNRMYLVWVDPNLPVGVSPLGFMPVSGLVMRLRNENMVYEVVSVNNVQVQETFFETKSDGYQFKEKAFRTGIVE
jgi:hypothetical protein